MKLIASSILTLGLQAALLFSLLIGVGVVTGALNVWLALILVVAINLLIWLVGPWFNDLMYNWLYSIEWIDIEDLRQSCPEAADVVEEVCRKNNYDVPKLGIIQDGNPTALTYGSDTWNARVIASEGLFNYLNSEEVAAVYAHEMGHITNRDFIIMTISSTIVSMLYITYSRLLRSSSAGSDRKGSSYLAIIGIVAFVFYIIAEFLLLYLSRIREYYADYFAASETDPNHLSTALVKIAYGIVDSSDDNELIEATKELGIMDSGVSRDKGAMYEICAREQDFRALERSFVFDMKNPWAKLGELRSTHPLVGNRVNALNKQSQKPIFDILSYMEKNPVDMGKMYSMFFQDVLFWASPLLAFIAAVLTGSYFMMYTAASTYTAFGAFALILGTAFAGRSWYKYNPNRDVGSTRILDLMADVYASPIRGKHAKLKGQFIGRGQAGYSLASNFQFRDETGMIFTNYKHLIPGLGDLYFGWYEAEEYIDQGVEVEGWFFRSTSSQIQMSGFETSNESRKSYTLLRSLGWGVLLMAGGVILLFL